jgi:hypothetical protein
MRRLRIVVCLAILTAMTTIAHAQPSFNVKNPPYNAAGNGITDDTAAFRAAILAASAHGGEIMVPAGTYLVSGSLAITAPGVTLVGEGPGASVLLTNQATGDVVAFGNVATPFNQCGGMRGLGIRSSVTRTAGSALTVDGCADGQFQNLLFQTTGGDGIHLCPASGMNGLCSVLFFNDTVINLSGAFSGLLVQGGNDRYFRAVHMGTFTPWITGSRGINIQASGGDWYTDVTANQFEYGVLINPGPGQGVTWLHMINVLTDQSHQGFRITGSPGAWVFGLTIQAPWATGATNPNSATNRGIFINFGSNIVIENPRVLNSGGHGIEIAGGTSVKVAGGFVANNSSASPGNYDAINVNSGASNFQIIGVSAGCGGLCGNPPSQRYGVSIGAGSDNFLVQGNDFTGNGTGDVQVSAGASATRRFLGNLPYNATLEKASSP